MTAHVNNQLIHYPCRLEEEVFKSQACVVLLICPLRTHARPVLRLLLRRTIPEAIKDGLLPLSDALGLTPPTATDAAPGSRINNRGVNVPGDQPNPVSREVPVKISCLPRLSLIDECGMVSNWRHGPRRSEGFSLVGGVPKVTLKPSYTDSHFGFVPLRAVIPATGLLSSPHSNPFVIIPEDRTI